jgi:hypothetical protein
MNDCIKASANKASLDPKKRLNYEFGMVLGVNDFRQEQEHHEWKHRLNNKWLHGYGTVYGLQVSAANVPSNDDVEIRISPGYAITPQGNGVSVEYVQCGQLNQWLQRHKNDSNFPSSAGRHRVFVTLCYDECLTELVPIAGQACASDDESAKPSRILESFKIEYAWQAPPEQLIEEKIRAFGKLMQRVQFVSDSSSPPELDDSELLIELIRDLGIVVASPPIVSSPPLSPPATIRLLEKTASVTWRRALNIWVTEVYPNILNAAHLISKENAEDCLLLAAINFNLNATGNLVLETVTIDESERPVLVSDRLKQELFCLIGGRTPV